jgi:hypothetical protein
MIVFDVLKNIFRWNPFFLNVKNTRESTLTGSANSSISLSNPPWMAPPILTTKSQKGASILEEANLQWLLPIGH